MTKRRDEMTPQEKIKSIYFAIGFAITQWQQIELALTQIFVLLMDAKQPNAASAAFASVLNFNSNLAMVDAVAYAVLGNTALFSEWETLRNSLGQKAKKRNELAHFMLYTKGVQVIPGEELDIKRLNRDVDWYLTRSFFDGAIMHRYGGNLPELTTKDIMNRGEAFTATSNRVWKFSEKILDLKMPRT